LNSRYRENPCLPIDFSNIESQNMSCLTEYEAIWKKAENTLYQLGNCYVEKNISLMDLQESKNTVVSAYLDIPTFVVNVRYLPIYKYCFSYLGTYLLFRYLPTLAFDDPPMSPCTYSR